MSLWPSCVPGSRPGPALPAEEAAAAAAAPPPPAARLVDDGAPPGRAGGPQRSLVLPAAHVQTWRVHGMLAPVARAVAADADEEEGGAAGPGADEDEEDAESLDDFIVNDMGGAKPAQQAARAAPPARAPSATTASWCAPQHQKQARRCPRRERLKAIAMPVAGGGANVAGCWLRAQGGRAGAGAAVPARLPAVQHAGVGQGVQLPLVHPHGACPRAAADCGLDAARRSRSIIKFSTLRRARRGDCRAA